MKHFTCKCDRKKWVEDNIIMTICPGCQVAMEERKINKEVDGDDNQ